MHVTDWVADFRRLRDYASLKYLRNHLYWRRNDRGVVVHHIPRISPALPFRALRSLNYRIMDRYVSSIVQHRQIDAIIGTFVAHPPSHKRLVFDLFDDNVAYWLSYGRVSGYADEIAEIESEYIRTANHVVVISSVLADKVARMGRTENVHLIPNGVRLASYGSSNRGHHIRTQLGLPRPILGLIGNHDKVVELERVLEAYNLVAKSRSGMSLLIVGRGSAIPRAEKYVEKTNVANVRFVGFIPSSEIAGYFQAIDVGLCPYTKTPGADASVPLRLLEYTAAGKPVVCTDLEEVRRIGFPNVVLTSDTAESLAFGIEKALQMTEMPSVDLARYDIAELARKYETVLQAPLAVSR